MQPETNTILTTPEPETPQADPSADTARESAVDAAPNQKAALHKRQARIAELRADPRIQELIAVRRVEKPDAFTPAPRHAFGAANRIGRADGGMAWFEPFVNNPTFSEVFSGWEIAKIFPGGDVEIYGHRAYSQGRGKSTVSAAYRTQRLAKVDKAALLRQNAELRAGMDALASQVTELNCQLIEYQLAVAAASKVTVSTSLNLAALDKPDVVDVDRAPEPPELLGQITSQVAEMVMCSERAQAIPVTKAWADDHTLAYLRLGWRLFTSPDEREEIAIRLLDDVCKSDPRERSATWIGLMRRVSLHGGIGTTPAQASGGAQ